MKNEKRCAASLRSNLYILPGNPTSPSSSKGFERRFFCGKARRIMLRGHDAATVTIGALSGGENSRGKPLGPQLHFANALNFDNVYADGNDHERNPESPI